MGAVRWAHGLYTSCRAHAGRVGTRNRARRASNTAQQPLRARLQPNPQGKPLPWQSTLELGRGNTLCCAATCATLRIAPGCALGGGSCAPVPSHSASRDHDAKWHHQLLRTFLQWRARGDRRGARDKEHLNSMRARARTTRTHVWKSRPARAGVEPGHGSARVSSGAPTCALHTRAQTPGHGGAEGGARGLLPAPR